MNTAQARRRAIGRRRRRQPSSREIHRRRLRTLFIGMAAMIVLVCILAVQTGQMRTEYARNQQIFEQMQQEKSREEGRSQELEIQREYVQSKEYIQKMAREKLGLVSEGEILIKPEE